MDIEELGMILSKNYDAIRDKNIEIENETAALERETRLRLEDMEAEIQNNIDDMKLQMGTLPVSYTHLVRRRELSTSPETDRSI